jgi:predicted transcriptional regulator
MIELISFVLAGKIRKEVMFRLIKPTQPGTIAKEIKTHLSTTSRAIKELMDKKLVKCLNEQNTNYRLYELTDLGRFVLEEIKKNY